MATVQEIEHVLKLAAKVVALYGETYLPTFQRVYRELQMAKNNQDQKTLALEIAMQYGE
ncbi:hypothetical protein [Niastella vici]|uniref:hypothetical protein n=1 Tax=Niastella vici TaxID=1703345 RepID=UPI001301EFA9|nr:hypothetical protein [Niastella vici]